MVIQEFQYTAQIIRISLKFFYVCVIEGINEDDICSQEKVQFYLELNRFGRAGYDSSQINPALLPHFFGRMSAPEMTSHFYYFLRHTPPDKLLLAYRPTPRKRNLREA